MYDKFLDKCNLDKQLLQTNLFGWIELIENEKLNKAIKSLKIEDQIFVSNIVKTCKMQQELAKTYDVTQQYVSKRFNRILKRLKKLMEG